MKTAKPNRGQQTLKPKPQYEYVCMHIATKLHTTIPNKSFVQYPQLKIKLNSHDTKHTTSPSNKTPNGRTNIFRQKEFTLMQFHSAT